ncbi:MAG: hypothetical protein JRM82_01005 [Nitrososphaerota archaeon]|nr:hypothetical protein [Nitrososphaerota archaeon]
MSLKGVGDFRVAYLYTTSPSTLYSLSEIHEYPLDYSVEGFAKSWKIDHVVPRRDLAQTIAFKSQSNNDAGRIGAEIAYCVATDKFGLPNVVMQDPSQPGPDLYTEDGRVLIEARLLQRTQNEKGAELDEDVTKQLNQMVRRLNHDFAATSSAVLGYAIFSFIDNQSAIRTLVLRVRNTRKTLRDSKTLKT